MQEFPKQYACLCGSTECSGHRFFKDADGRLLIEISPGQLMTIDADGHFWYGLYTSVADPEKEETNKHAHEQLPLPKSAGEMATPRPWRSAQETRAINRVVWQSFTYRGPRKWSARAVARCLGLSQTYVQKLVRGFYDNPSGTQRDARRHTTAHS